MADISQISEIMDQGAQGNQQNQEEKAETPKEEDQEIAKKVQDWYKRAKEVKNSRTPSKDFKTFYRYYRKKQLPEIKNVTIPNSVTNMIFSIIETQLPVMTDNRPIINVIPESEIGMTTEMIEERVHIADILKKLIDRIWFNQKLDIKVPEALKDALICGTGFFSPAWNPKLDDGLGDIEVNVINPRYVFPEENATSVEDADYIIFAIPRSVASLKCEYPQFADEIIPEEVDSDYFYNINDGDYQLTADTQNSQSFIERSSALGSESKNMAVLLTCFVADPAIEDYEEKGVDEAGAEITKQLKRLKYPNGRLFKVVGKVKLEDISNPEPRIKYPLVRIIDYNFSNVFWAIGEVEQTIDKQDIINNAYNKLSRIINLATSPVTVIDASTGIEPDTWVNKTGAVYIKNAGSPDPTWLTPPGVTAIQPIVEFININKQDMRDISGIQETSQGQRSAGVNSGVMVEQLNEAVYTRIRLKMRNFEQALIDLGEMLIKLIQNHYTTARMVQITLGDKNQFVAINEKTAEPQIDPQTNQPIQSADGTIKLFEKVKNDVTIGKYRCQVVAGSTLPKNKMVRLAKAEQYYAQGILGDPKGVEAKGELLKHADWPDRDAVMTRLTTEQEEAAKNQPSPEQQIAQQVLEKTSISFKDLPTFAQNELLQKAGVTIPKPGTQPTQLPQEQPKVANPMIPTNTGIPNA